MVRTFLITDIKSKAPPLELKNYKRFTDLKSYKNDAMIRTYYRAFSKNGECAFRRREVDFDFYVSDRRKTKTRATLKNSNPDIDYLLNLKI